ncbi:tetratricopeptide repeat protein [Nitrincola tapanii]|uniref:Sel1 repeat family protein n=1 Tax=Nitrincola tapanii TaxID=1708751 RepID=A0A5A9W1X3_9GAMM|nr:tetratricopeptide repeat protein [Nitrincola tapanii]KAA0874726.1 sel1 repeat family protein [Nitrincola tapanii]
MKKLALAAAGLALTLCFSPVYASSLASARADLEAENYNQALTTLKLLVRDGDADASNLLGQMYEQGLGVDVDETEAARLYDLGARQGHLDSVTSLRALRNKAYAEEFARILPLAEAGNSEAQNRIGEMLEFGMGVERNGDEAYNWYQRAAEQGDISAWHNLGRSYNFGTGVEQDFATAERWYLQAAERGYTNSLFYLGTLYATDHGTDDSHNPDIIAYAWLQNAAELGDKTAQPIAQRLLMKLDEAEIETAKVLAEEYKSRYVKN